MTTVRTWVSPVGAVLSPACLSAAAALRQARPQP